MRKSINEFVTSSKEQLKKMFSDTKPYIFLNNYVQHLNRNYTPDFYPRFLPPRSTLTTIARQRPQKYYPGERLP